ncbi:hypothetical protein TNCV_2907251 [Trichonephila clavipes]|nr:hypothetical protein TNCV_2907251 [Trichonephila clavipes]
MQPGNVLLKYRAGFALQQVKHSRLHDFYEAEVRCQMGVNVYLRHSVIKHYATSKHNALRWTGLTRNGLVRNDLKVTNIPIDTRCRFLHR